MISKVQLLRTTSVTRHDKRRGHAPLSGGGREDMYPKKRSATDHPDLSGPDRRKEKSSRDVEKRANALRSPPSKQARVLHSASRPARKQLTGLPSRQVQDRSCRLYTLATDFSATTPKGPGSRGKRRDDASPVKLDSKYHVRVRQAQYGCGNSPACKHLHHTPPTTTTVQPRMEFPRSGHSHGGMVDSGATLVKRERVGGFIGAGMTRTPLSK